MLKNDFQIGDRVLKDRKWETSYTKRVIDELIKGGYVGRPILDACDLLEQYHRDLHLPYEQRDYQLKLNTALNKDLTRATDRIKELEGDLRAVRAHLAEANNIARGEHKFNSPFGENRQTWNIFAGEGRSTRAAAEQQAAQNEARMRSWAPLKQTYVACPHYPNAIHNFFSKKDSCEFCMKDGK